MTGVEWFDAPRPALMRMPRLGGHVRGGFSGGLIAAAAVCVAALLWNWSSDGGLIRGLGGITSQQLAGEIAAHPGPRGPQGPAGPMGPPGPAAEAAASIIAPPSAAVPVVRLVPQNEASYDKSGPIAHSEGYALCTLSKAALRRDGKSPDGSCQVKRGTHAGGAWEVIVNGASCSVTCFNLSTSK